MVLFQTIQRNTSPNRAHFEYKMIWCNPSKTVHGPTQFLDDEIFVGFLPVIRAGYQAVVDGGRKGLEVWEASSRHRKERRWQKLGNSKAHGGQTNHCKNSSWIKILKGWHHYTLWSLTKSYQYQLLLFRLVMFSVKLTKKMFSWSATT